MDTRKCIICQQELSSDNFYKHMRKCKKCYCEMTHKYYVSHREQALVRGITRAKENPYRHWAKNTLSKHRSRGNVVNITTDELEKIARSTKYCSLCGTELIWQSYKGSYLDNSPSLDRINNGNILDFDSIMILCRRCNVSKYNRTLPEFISYCKHIVEKWGDLIDV